MGIHTDRNAALDGIRGIALLVVVACHTEPYRLVGGNIGVDLFFVLSGFLITSILLNEHDRTGSINIPRFYLRRFLRLMPASLSVVLFSVVYAYFTEPPLKFVVTLTDAKWVMAYAWNWHLVIAGTHYADHQNMFMHFWSLAVEEQFYLVWPALLSALLWLKPQRSILILLLLFGLVAPAVGRFMSWEGGASLWLYFRTDLRADALVWGVGLAWIMHNGFELRPVRLLLPWLGPVALATLLFMSGYNLLSNGVLYQGGFSFVGFLSATIIASAMISPAPWFKWLLEMRWLRWVGRISYGLYLWHVPLVIIFSTSPFSQIERALLMLAATFTISTLSYYYLEMPFLRLKDRIGYGHSGAAHSIRRS